MGQRKPLGTREQANKGCKPLKPSREPPDLTLSGADALGIRNARLRSLVSILGIGEKPKGPFSRLVCHLIPAGQGCKGRWGQPAHQNPERIRDNSPEEAFSSSRPTPLRET